MSKHSKTTAVLFTLVLGVGLTGCQESAVKRDKPAPPVSEQFMPAGHINAKVKVEDKVQSSASIPSLVTTQIPTLPPLGSSNQTTKTYSVSAVNVPVSELLFKLAQDANKDIDLYAGLKGKVTINALNQPLNQILERMADQVGFNFDIVGDTVVIKPDYPEWRNYKVDYVNIRKTSKDSIDMKMNVSASSDSSSGGAAASSTKVTVESEHDFWAQLEKNIQLLAQIDPNANQVILGGKPEADAGAKSKPKTALSSISQNTVINPEAGVISVYTTIKKHKAIKNYIEEVSERAERQVLIEATVVEVALNDAYQAGIDWSLMNGMFGDEGGLKFSSPFAGPSDGFSITTIDNTGVVNGIGEFNILANLQLLKQFGDSKVLSSPKVMAINNQTALLKVVNNLVYFTVDVNVTPATDSSAATTTYETEIHTVPVGFTMSVTPFVSDNGNVTLNVRPTISRKIGEVTDPNPDLAAVGTVSTIPIVQEKEMSSVLKLKDRQTAIIGGLIEDANSNVKSGLPWASDVPIVGDLFARRDDSTQKSELVIFIRPIIVKNPNVDNGDLQSVSRFLKKTENY